VAQGKRVLPFDLRTAHAVAIAATAEVHGLTILTDSERHFAPLGVPMLNPLKNLPPLRESAADRL
jgi:predicted nucleic acid-binding protein